MQFLASNILENALFLLFIDYKCYISKPTFCFMALTIPDSMNNISRGFTTRDLFFHLGFGLRTRASMARVWLEYDSGMAQVRLGIIFMFSITDYQLQCCKRLRPILCIHICHFSNAVSLYRRSQLAMQAFLGILSLHIVPFGNH